MSEPSRLPTRDVSALLMAVIDGEADPSDCARALGIVAADPKLAADAEAFRLTGRSLGRLFDGILAQPVPGQLIHSVRTQSLGLQGARRAGARGRVQWLSWFGGWRLPATVFAASVIAFACGTVWGPSTLHSDPALASGALAAALSVATTGTERDIVTAAGGLKMKVVETFRDHAGAMCREFEAQAGAGPRQFGVACKSANGWQIKAQLFGEARSAGQTTTAGDELGTVLDDVAGRIRDGDAVPLDAERKLIADGWRTAP